MHVRRGRGKKCAAFLKNMLGKAPKDRSPIL